MSDEIVLTVNGKLFTVQSAPDTPLLYVLRNELGLNGPHFGCGGEKCGRVWCWWAQNLNCPVPAHFPNRVLTYHLPWKD